MDLGLAVLFKFLLLSLLFPNNMNLLPEDKEVRMRAETISVRLLRRSLCLAVILLDQRHKSSQECHLPWIFSPVLMR